MVPCEHCTKTIIMQSTDNSNVISDQTITVIFIQKSKETKKSINKDLVLTTPKSNAVTNEIKTSTQSTHHLVLNDKLENLQDQQSPVLKPIEDDEEDEEVIDDQVKEGDTLIYSHGNIS